MELCIGMMEGQVKGYLIKQVVLIEVWFLHQEKQPQKDIIQIKLVNHRCQRGLNSRVRWKCRWVNIFQRKRRNREDSYNNLCKVMMTEWVPMSCTKLRREKERIILEITISLEIYLLFIGLQMQLLILKKEMKSLLRKERMIL